MEPIKKLFQGKVFKKYEQKKSELEDLQKKFVKNIPKEIHSNVKVKNKIGGLIIVETTSSAVAHKIKMTSSSILNKINNDNSLNLEKIKVKIAIHNPDSKRKKQKKSISSISSMKKLSTEIKNSPLKIYLKKLFKEK
ncbi:MAG: DciA family protein [Methylophilaceae bacterium]